MTEMTYNHVSKKTGVIVFVGTGRSGKTATAHNLMNKAYNERPIATNNYPKKLREEWGEHHRGRIYNVSDPYEVEPGSIYFLDDIGLALLARNYGGKDAKRFYEWLTISSHKDVLTIITTQLMRIMDVSVLLPQDTTIIQKYVNPYAISQDKEEFQAILKAGNHFITTFAEMVGGINPKSISYVHGEGFRLDDLPSYWNDDFSQPYRRYAPDGY